MHEEDVQPSQFLLEVILILPCIGRIGIQLTVKLFSTVQYQVTCFYSGEHLRIEEPSLVCLKSSIELSLLESHPDGLHVFLLEPDLIPGGELGDVPEEVGFKGRLIIGGGSTDWWLECKIVTR